MNIDYTDEISPSEAKLIAQKFLLSHMYSEQFAVTMPELDTSFLPSYPQWKGVAWVVSFPSKSITYRFTGGVKRSFVVIVDKKTGNIRAYKYVSNQGEALIVSRDFGETGLPLQEAIKKQ